MQPPSHCSCYKVGKGTISINKANQRVQSAEGGRQFSIASEEITTCNTSKYDEKIGNDQAKF